jgi:hypothetical protein
VQLKERLPDVPKRRPSKTNALVQDTRGDATPPRPHGSKSASGLKAPHFGELVDDDERDPLFTTHSSVDFFASGALHDIDLDDCHGGDGAPKGETSIVLEDDPAAGPTANTAKRASRRRSQATFLDNSMDDDRHHSGLGDRLHSGPIGGSHSNVSSAFNTPFTEPLNAVAVEEHGTPESNEPHGLSALDHGPHRALHRTPSTTNVVGMVRSRRQSATSLLDLEDGEAKPLSRAGSMHRSGSMRRTDSMRSSGGGDHHDRIEIRNQRALEEMAVREAAVRDRSEHHSAAAVHGRRWLEMIALAASTWRWLEHFPQDRDQTQQHAHATAVLRDVFVPLWRRHLRRRRANASFVLQRIVMRFAVRRRVKRRDAAADVIRGFFRTKFKSAPHAFLMLRFRLVGLQRCVRRHLARRRLMVDLNLAHIRGVEPRYWERAITTRDCGFFGKKEWARGKTVGAALVLPRLPEGLLRSRVAQAVTSHSRDYHRAEGFWASEKKALGTRASHANVMSKLTDAATTLADSQGSLSGSQHASFTHGRNTSRLDLHSTSSSRIVGATTDPIPGTWGSSAFGSEPSITATTFEAAIARVDSSDLFHNNAPFVQPPSPRSRNPLPPDTDRPPDKAPQRSTSGMLHPRQNSASALPPNGSFGASGASSRADSLSGVSSLVPSTKHALAQLSRLRRPVWHAMLPDAVMTAVLEETCFAVAELQSDPRWTTHLTGSPLL